MNFRIFLSIAFLMVVYAAFPQRNKQVVEKKGVIYKKDFSMGIRWYTQGYGIFAEIGRQQGYSKKKFYQLEIAEILHPKQTKTSADNSSNNSSAKSYFFGKQNTFFVLHGGYGYRKLIGEKSEKSGVEVSWSYLIGGSIGLLKPYYIYLEGSSDAPSQAIKYSEENELQFLDKNSINGSAGLIYGIEKTKIMPGLHGKLILHFDWARHDEALKEIQIGFSLDAYLKKVPIMVIETNRQFFPQVFAGLAFGRRR